jgi:hypothetical protein
MSTDLRPTNPKGKKFSWSFSAINDFDTCPEQYAAKRYYETVKFTDTVATLWGTRVHDAAEHRLGPSKVPLHKDMPEVLETFCRVMEGQGGILIPEAEITYNLDAEITGWFAKDAWARCKVDVLIINGDTAYIYDWKTGKKKDNLLQLQIFMWFVAHKYPEVENFITRFIWLKEGITERVSGEDFTRMEHLNGIEVMLGEKLSRMGTSWREEVFQAKPSGLCHGWCPVDKCVHCKPKKGWR